MILARIRTADLVTGLWGAGLLVALSLDWYVRPEGGVSAWGAFGVLDVLLALVGLLALALPLTTAGSSRPAWPVAHGVVLIALTFLTGLFLVYRLLDQPGLDRDVAVDAGAWIGGFTVLGVFCWSYLALRDERAPAIESPGEISVLPAPPRDAA